MYASLQRPWKAECLSGRPWLHCHRACSFCAHGALALAPRRGPRPMGSRLSWGRRRVVASGTRGRGETRGKEKGNAAFCLCRLILLAKNTLFCY